MGETINGAHKLQPYQHEGILISGHLAGDGGKRIQLMPDHKGFESRTIAPLGIAREPNYQAVQSLDSADLCGSRLAWDSEKNVAPFK